MTLGIKENMYVLGNINIVLFKKIPPLDWKCFGPKIIVMAFFCSLNTIFSEFSLLGRSHQRRSW